MLKRSTHISQYSSNYWSNLEHRSQHSRKLKATQAGRHALLSAAAKQSWLDNRDSLIAGIRKGMTANKKEAISNKLKSKWNTSLAARSKAFITKAVDRHGDRFNYDNIIYVSYFDNIIIQCNICNKEFSQTPSNHIRGSGCPYCNLSQGHSEILTAIGGSPLVNDRKSIHPFEIDILYEQEQVGIEFHGMYWHSCGIDETNDDRLYHQQKWAMAFEKGIHLLQFFEHEWTFKKDIVISMINHRMKRSVRLNARDLTGSTSRNPSEFYNLNHLQGNRSAAHHFCLLDGDEIIMAASLSRHQDGYELIRMATKIGMCVRGGISKLFSLIAKTFPGAMIMTYADLRHADAKGYQAIGFSPEAITAPGYFYCKGLKTWSRHQCQKTKLPKLLDKFLPNLSESANMFMNGYRRMWDAGHMRLSLTL